MIDGGEFRLLVYLFETPLSTEDKNSLEDDANDSVVRKRMRKTRPDGTSSESKVPYASIIFEVDAKNLKILSGSVQISSFPGQDGVSSCGIKDQELLTPGVHCQLIEDGISISGSISGGDEYYSKIAGDMYKRQWTISFDLARRLRARVDPPTIDPKK